MVNITKKQDINLVRKPVDLETKYKLQELNPTIDEVEELKNKSVDDHLSTISTNPVQNKVITRNLNNKVAKEVGKGLSTNDFTNEYKTSVDSSSANSHTHANKSTLDTITNNDITSWNSKSNQTITTLYDNSTGTIGDIVFTTELLSTIDCIDIVFGNSSNIYDSKRIYNPIGRIISLTLGSCSATSYANRTQTLTISATGITTGSRHKFALSSTGVITVTNSANVVDEDKIIIYKVIGYKL